MSTKRHLSNRQGATYAYSRESVKGMEYVKLAMKTLKMLVQMSPLEAKTTLHLLKTDPNTHPLTSILTAEQQHPQHQ